MKKKSPRGSNFFIENRALTPLRGCGKAIPAPAVAAGAPTETSIDRRDDTIKKTRAKRRAPEVGAESAL